MESSGEVVEVFVNAPEDLLKCPICFDLFKDPVLCPGCAHTFCALCFSRSIKLKASCPTCRANVDATSVKKNRLVAEMLDSLLVHCRWGITQKDTSNESRSSASGSSSNNNNTNRDSRDGTWVVDAQGCPATFKRSLRQAHERECPHAIVRCSHAAKGISALHIAHTRTHRKHMHTHAHTQARHTRFHGALTPHMIFIVSCFAHCRVRVAGQRDAP